MREESRKTWVGHEPHARGIAASVCIRQSPADGQLPIRHPPLHGWMARQLRPHGPLGDGKRAGSRCFQDSGAKPLLLQLAAARWERELSGASLRSLWEHEVVALQLLRRGREVREWGWA